MLILLAVYCHAQLLASNATFGFEFTFTNKWLLTAEYADNYTTGTEEADTYRELYKRRLAEMCPDCRIRSVKDRYGEEAYRVTIADGPYKGWGFTISLDPGVIEVVVDPLSFQQLADLHNKGVIQKYIFDAAAKANLYPSAEGGGGHLNLGLVSSFKGKPRLFRNFLVDQANRPELATGIFEFDFTNSPPLAALPKTRKAVFKRLIAKYDRGEFDASNDPHSLKKMVRLARAINEEVYYGNSVVYRGWEYEGGGATPKDHYLNMTTISNPRVPLEQKRLEIRGIRAQVDSADAFSLAALFDRYLDYLDSLKTDVEVLEVTIPSRAKTKANRFYNWIQEIGAKWKNQKHRIPQAWLAHINSLCPVPKVKGRLSNALQRRSRKPLPRR